MRSCGFQSRSSMDATGIMAEPRTRVTAPALTLFSKYPPLPPRCYETPRVISPIVSWPALLIWEGLPPSRCPTLDELIQPCNLLKFGQAIKSGEGERGL